MPDDTQLKSDKIELLYVENTPINGVPTTAAKFDELAGREGACIDNAWDYQKYHVHAAKLRWAVMLMLEKESGLEIEKTTKNGKTKIDEKPQVYVDRLIQSEFVTGDPKDSAVWDSAVIEFVQKYGSKIHELAGATPVDLTKKARIAGATAKISQAYLDYAQINIIDAGKVSKACNLYGIDETKVYGEDGSVSEEGKDLLARGVRARNLEKRRQAEAAAKAATQAEIADL